MRVTVAIVVSLSIGGALAACGTDDDRAPFTAGPASAEVGTGVAAFGALADGDRLPIVQGIQGGYMVPLSARARGVSPGDDSDPASPDNPRIEYRLVRHADDALLGSATRARGLTRGDDAYELVGTWVLFDPSLETTAFVDHDVRIELDVTDARGVTASDAVVVWTTAPN